MNWSSQMSMKRINAGECVRNTLPSGMGGLTSSEKTRKIESETSGSKVVGSFIILLRETPRAEAVLTTRPQFSAD